MIKEDFKTLLIVLLTIMLIYTVGYVKGVEESANEAIHHYKTRILLKEELILILEKHIDYLDKKLDYKDSITNSKQ